VIRFENIWPNCERCAAVVSTSGSITSICSISRRRPSVEFRAEFSPDEGRKSKLDLADSTVGGVYLEGLLGVSSRSRPRGPASRDHR
jgi:hypothetical protein